MKIHMISLLYTFVLLVSCSKTNQNFDNKIEWQLGHEKSEEIKVFQNEDSDELKLSIDRNSLCDNSGIQIVIQQNNSTIYDKKHTLSFDTIIRIQPNSEIKIISTVFVIPNSAIVCVWLGLANIKVQY